MSVKFKSNHTIKQRLISAAVMLAISAAMMVSSTYAWFVMSTAPEVANIETSVGANGALEMALLDKDSWADLSRLDAADFDESGELDSVAANLTWGNLVDLGDNAYGLSHIILQPSRLYIEQNGVDENGKPKYKINSTILKTPVYGTDGRIERLDKTSAVSYVYGDSKFGTDGYGVRAIGTSAQMSIFQLGMTEARSELITNASGASSAAATTLRTSGSDLAKIVIDYGVSNKTEGYTVEQVMAIEQLAEGLKNSLLKIDSSVRQAFVGYIMTNTSGVSAENLTTEKQTVLDTATTLSSLLTKYPGASAAGITSAQITVLENDLTTVKNVINNCNSAIAGGGTFTWNQITSFLTPLCNTDALLVNGKGLDELKAALKNPDGSVNMAEGLALVSDGITISVPTGSGIISDIADFSGDYTASITIKDFTYENNNFGDVSAKMKTVTATNPTHLNNYANLLKTLTLSEASGSQAITDYYGYAIDLAFRTNSETANLILQTESENRIYEGDTANNALQGGGSFMEFRTESGISATKMVNLMKAVRVVFMDKDQNLLAIAALDCQLGKDVYAELSIEEKEETKMFAYLDGTNDTHQISDLIPAHEYETLPDESHVIFDKIAGTVKAKLYLYDFIMTVSGSSTPEETKFTGGITLQNRKTDAVITDLQQDIPKIVTTVVYLDGSFVTNAMVAADSARSMVGNLNIQFATDAELIPAENYKLRNGEDESSSESSEVPEP